MRHKKILFDQIRVEKRQEKKQFDSQALTYNLSINLFYMLIKLLSIAIVTLVGSILFSAFITAATQDEPFLKTLEGMIKGIIDYLNWWF